MLKRSKDRKVTNSVTPSGNVAIANTFGLPAGQAYSCPGATPFCETICYAGRLETQYKNVRNVLLHNWELLRNANRATMVELLDAMITEFKAECDKRNARKEFRIHWDGDFFSHDYTMAWIDVIANHTDVQFWVYTRVADAAREFHSALLVNLAYYFSGDRDNLAIARELEELGINIAYVDNTFQQGKVEFTKATKCPENNKSIPLISAKGSACQLCGLCINGRKSVLFSTTKK
jgi:hypothetical protein